MADQPQLSDDIKRKIDKVLSKIDDSEILSGLAKVPDKLRLI